MIRQELASRAGAALLALLLAAGSASAHPGHGATACCRRPRASVRARTTCSRWWRSACGRPRRCRPARRWLGPAGLPGGDGCRRGARRSRACVLPFVEAGVAASVLVFGAMLVVRARACRPRRASRWSPLARLAARPGARRRAAGGRERRRLRARLPRRARRCCTPAASASALALRAARRAAVAGAGRALLGAAGPRAAGRRVCEPHEEPP